MSQLMTADEVTQAVLEDAGHDPVVGSFVTGLSIGLVAGAVGYFLFQTDEGAEVREELRKEWQAAEDYITEEVVLLKPMKSISKLVARIFG